MPTRRFFGLAEGILKFGDIVVGIFEFFIGLMNIWMPELETLLTMESLSEVGNEDEMRFSYLMGML